MLIGAAPEDEMIRTLKCARKAAPLPLVRRAICDIQVVVCARSQASFLMDVRDDPRRAQLIKAKGFIT